MAKRRNFSAQFKAKVALEALRGERTLSELAARYPDYARDLNSSEIWAQKKGRSPLI